MGNIRRKRTTSPELFLHGLICSNEDDVDEIIDIARCIKAVSDSHEWIDQISRVIDDGTETIVTEIIKACSKADGWSDYVKPIREWMIERADL